MTRVVQSEPPAVRAARLRRVQDILAGKVASLDFVPELDVHNLQLGDDVMSQLIDRIAAAPSVVALSLGWNVLRAGAVRALVGSSLAPRLTSLELSGNHLGDEGIRVLSAGEFPSLRVLRLSWCELEDGVAKPLAEARGMPALVELGLRRNRFTDAGAGVFAASGVLRGRLERLDFEYNDALTGRGIGLLSAAFGEAYF